VLCPHILHPQKPRTQDTVASLQVALAPNNQATPVTRRTQDDLPTHVKGTVKWNRPNRRYYIPQHLTANNTLEPVEFINNCWHELRYDASAHTFYTQENLAIPIQNMFGIGYWNTTDPQHPEYQPNALEPPPVPLSDTRPDRLTPVTLLRDQTLCQHTLQ
jgi:hypothetical protein